MNRIIIIFLTLIAFCSSCNLEDKKKNKPIEEEEVEKVLLYVHPLKVPCSETDEELNCLEVQNYYAVDIDFAGARASFDKPWIIKNNIKGFKFEPYFEYKIIVKEESNSVGSGNYSLLHVVRKTSTVELGEKWKLTRIDKKLLHPSSEFKLPTIKYHLRNLKYTGQDPCGNRFYGKFTYDKRGFKVGSIKGVKGSCEETDIFTQFSEKLQMTHSYECDGCKTKSGGLLKLFDENLNEVLRFVPTK